MENNQVKKKMNPNNKAHYKGKKNPQKSVSETPIDATKELPVVKLSSVKKKQAVVSNNSEKLVNTNKVVENKAKDHPKQTNSLSGSLQNQKKNKAPKVNITNNTQKKKIVNNNNDIKIFSLGGIGVVGMNMYIVEQQDEIIIMDAGILFASDDVHGVNYIIPDFTYLIENEKKIVGLFVTHGHEDHIGALPFLLQKVHIPAIFATGLAIGLINNKMAEFPNIPYTLKEYTDDSIFSYKHFEVSFFKTNHSIPDSYGIAIKTNLGNIVNTGDFKFDFSPIGPSSDYYKMTKLGKEGVVCLLAESTNANIAQFSSSERKIGSTLLSIFKQLEGRVIVATFASNVYRVQQIIEASIETGRKVIVFGHSMEKTIEVATRLKYINAPKGWIQKARDLKKIESDNITILCTGSQGEPLAALSRIAQGTHKQIKIKENDTIIYSSKPIPGNEQFINRNINLLVHSGAHVIKNNPLTDTHTTGHASQNELRMMLAFMKPKYFVPVHGEYSMLKKHTEIAYEMGVEKGNAYILKAGEALVLNQKSAKVITDAFPANDVFLDNSLSDVDSRILKDRKKMVDDGMVSVTYSINKKFELVNSPIINLKGFSTAVATLKIMDSLNLKCKDIYNNLITGNKHIVLTGIEKQLVNQLNQYFYAKFERKPLVIVEILQVMR